MRKLKSGKGIEDKSLLLVRCFGSCLMRMLCHAGRWEIRRIYLGTGSQPQYKIRPLKSFVIGPDRPPFPREFVFASAPGRNTAVEVYVFCQLLDQAFCFPFDSLWGPCIIIIIIIFDPAQDSNL